jgi:hypothetical protein
MVDIPGIPKMWHELQWMLDHNQTLSSRSEVWIGGRPMKQGHGIVLEPVMWRFCNHSVGRYRELKRKENEI